MTLWQQQGWVNLGSPSAGSVSLGTGHAKVNSETGTSYAYTRRQW